MLGTPRGEEDPTIYMDIQIAHIFIALPNSILLCTKLTGSRPDFFFSPLPIFDPKDGFLLNGPDPACAYPKLEAKRNL